MLQIIIKYFYDVEHYLGVKNISFWRQKVRKILVTGGTVFVSKYITEYYVGKGEEVYVLNRNTRTQVKGTHLIQCDRHNLASQLKEIELDVVIDVTSYDAVDVVDLTNALGLFGKYIMISSSAVYPDTGRQPFVEEQQLGANKFWEKYGTDKIEAEKALLAKIPDAYIVRPPYLYGPMNNVYREAFVFECAMKDRAFYLPKDGAMKLQFFYVKDLCRFIDAIIDNNPVEHIFNVGNKEMVSIKEWVEICYSCTGKTAEYVNVYKYENQRDFFSFYDYEYYLDVKKQNQLMPETTPLLEGIKESYEWYCKNKEEVKRKPFIDFIDDNLKI